jgi:hypothetical protein
MQLTLQQPLSLSSSSWILHKILRIEKQCCAHVLLEKGLEKKLLQGH